MLLARVLSDFAGNVLATVVGGIVVAVVAYVLVERRLELREQRTKRAEIAEGILRALADELSRNRRVAESLLKHLPKGALPYSGFELSGWMLLSQVPAFTALDGKTVKSLLDAYVLTRSANEQHSLLFDLTYGATGALSFVVAGASASEAGRQSFNRLEEQREDLRRRLLRRVEDLHPRLVTALTQIEKELSR